MRPKSTTPPKRNMIARPRRALFQTDQDSLSQISQQREPAQGGTFAALMQC
jgi:hypothetical protein